MFISFSVDVRLYRKDDFTNLNKYKYSICSRGYYIFISDYAYSNFIHLTDPVRFTLGISLK